MSSSTQRRPSPKWDPRCRPALSLACIVRRIALLPAGRRGALIRLVDEVGRGDFWIGPRFIQIVRMLDKKNVHHVSQKEIAFVLRVSKGRVTKLKQYHDLHPDALVHLDAGYEPGLMKKLKDGDLDFAILENESIEDGISSETLGRSQLIFCAPDKPPYN